MTVPALVSVLAEDLNSHRTDLIGECVSHLALHVLLCWIFKEHGPSQLQFIDSPSAGPSGKVIMDGPSLNRC